MFTRSSPNHPTADVIPFFEDGWYHLFYLSPIDIAGDRLRTTWEHIRSRDLVSWEQLPTAIEPRDQDVDRDAAWTGSICKIDDKYVVFYTARDLQRSDPQRLSTSVSIDLAHFEKADWTGLPAPSAPDWDIQNWRDPHVFQTGDGRFHMTLSARRPTVDDERTGVVAIADSDDGYTWGPARAFYEAGDTFCPECTDVRKIGETFILSYSTFSDRREVTFRISDTFGERWAIPQNSTPDGAWWYAAKSLTNAAGEVISFGWVPDTKPSTSGRRPAVTEDRTLWGGDLAIPRQLWMPASDELAWRLPDSIRDAFGERVGVEFHDRGEDRSLGKGKVTVGTVDSIARVDLTHEFDAGASLTEFDLEMEGQGRVSILVDVSEARDRGFSLTFDAATGIAVMRPFAPAGHADALHVDVVSHPFPSGTRLHLDLVRRGSVIEFCLNDRTWFTTRSSETATSLGLLCDGVALTVTATTARAGDDS